MRMAWTLTEEPIEPKTSWEEEDGDEIFSENDLSRYEQDFEEIRLLGEGGFGSVYEAKLIFDQQVYAVKKISLKGS